MRLFHEFVRRPFIRLGDDDIGAHRLHVTYLDRIGERRILKKRSRDDLDGLLSQFVTARIDEIRDDAAFGFSSDPAFFRYVFAHATRFCKHRLLSHSEVACPVANGEVKPNGESSCNLTNPMMFMPIS